MAQEFEISGMHCGGCVNRVAKALRALDAGVAVTLEPPRATFSAEAQVSLDLGSMTAPNRAKQDKRRRGLRRKYIDPLCSRRKRFDRVIV